MEHAAESDPGILLAALGEPTNGGDTHADLALAFRRAAVARHGGRAREARNRLWRACRISAAIRWRATGDDILFIEGVGGVMVPLDANHTVLDWIADLEIPAILVAGAYLGTISHTLTALGALARRGIVPRAVVVNDRGDGPVPPDETLGTIARFAPAPAFAAIAHDAGDDDFAALAALLLR